MQSFYASIILKLMLHLTLTTPLDLDAVTAFLHVADLT